MLKLVLRMIWGLWIITLLASILALAIGQQRNYPVITFRAEIDNQTDIFLLDPHIGEWFNLTETTAPEWSFAWSPGAYLAYTASFDSAQAGDELFFMTRLGLAREIKTPNSLSTFGGVWSPDNTTYAYYSSYPRNISDLYLLNVSDESITNITATASLSETDPLWSPDGQDLLYQLDGDLYRYHLATGISHPLADIAGTDIESPVWAPDSEQIIFYVRQFTDGQNQLIAYLVDRNGSTPQRLEFPEIINSPVTWAPDSQSVAFIGNSTDLIFYDLESDHIQSVTGDMRRFAPTWSPDGRWLAFIQNRHLYAYDLNRQQIRPLLTQGQIKPPLHWRQ